MAEPPIEVMGAFAREQAELAANGLPTGIAPAGTILPDADLLDMHGAATRCTLRLDLTGVNADGTVTLPMPATVILDVSRTVRWIDVHPDYSTRTEPRQVINALDHLGH